MLSFIFILNANYEETYEFQFRFDDEQLNAGNNTNFHIHIIRKTVRLVTAMDMWLSLSAHIAIFQNPFAQKRRSCLEQVYFCIILCTILNSIYKAFLTLMLALSVRVLR